MIDFQAGSSTLRSQASLKVIRECYFERPDPDALTLKRMQLIRCAGWLRKEVGLRRAAAEEVNSEYCKEMNMTDQELKDLVAGLALKSDRIDAQQAKTEAALASLAAAQEITQAELAETQRVMKEVSRRMGAMGDNQGDVAEEFFYNSLREKMTLAGIEFDTIYGNFVIGTKKKNSELDILMVNGQSVAVIEVKYKAHTSDLDQVERKVADYRTLRPEHENFKVYAGIAGMSVPSDVIDEAHKRGLFVLKQSGNVIEVDSEGMRAF